MSESDSPAAEAVKATEEEPVPSEEAATAEATPAETAVTEQSSDKPPPNVDQTAKATSAEKETASGETAPKRPKVDMQSLPARAYLDKTVVPILLQGLSALAKERPPNPVEYLATYLMKNSDQ